ncbi:MAG: hypothetical protein KZQ77_00190 [Candidatus Thiodiazotropha sp. (ex Notomyrtea botanica)]|nr:hypothetical protein [Candidatus Thiodiazotropha sp. (ex Notomyrtea botanica)]
MYKRLNIMFVFLTIFLVGCAHKINLTPPLHTLDLKEISQIAKNVGYHISADDLTKEVQTPGGGGDSVKYTPYSDLEPALEKALSNIFSDVYAVENLDDTGYLKSNDITYIFLPTIETDSSSSSLLTWPPTDFSISLQCKVVNNAGSTVWESTVTGEGNAEFSEFKHDFSLAARRAAKDAFLKLENEIIQANEFK